jgi:hypothetical protein
MAEMELAKDATMQAIIVYFSSLSPLEKTIKATPTMKM